MHPASRVRDSHAYPGAEDGGFGGTRGFKGMAVWGEGG
jgi:hypothetical protein